MIANRNSVLLREWTRSSCRLLLNPVTAASPGKITQRPVTAAGSGALIGSPPTTAENSDCEKNEDSGDCQCEPLEEKKFEDGHPTSASSALSR
jgi:hypothetical protein